MPASRSLQRAVVLGGSGFIGSRLVTRLVQRGVSCVSLDLHAPAEAVAGAEYITASILDSQALEAAIAGADAVFAFAGLSGAARGTEGLEEDLALNVRAQILLLEAIRTRNPEAQVVFPGSRLEYGVPRYLPIDEAHPVDPQSGYAVHKYAAGRYHQIYHREHGLRSVVLRISNPFGPHVRLDGQGYSVLNQMIDRALADEALTVFGDGAQVRDYIYVDDLVDAVLAASVSDSAVGQVINVGSGRPTRFIDAARAVVEVVGRGRVEFAEWPDAWSAVETGSYYFDISLARQLLDWQPSTDLEAGLRATLAAAAPDTRG